MCVGGGGGEGGEGPLNSFKVNLNLNSRGSNICYRGGGGGGGGASNFFPRRWSQIAKR